MQKIEAIIRFEKLEEVKVALESIGYPGLTVTEVEGHGKQKGIVQQWRGEKYRVDLVPKIKIEIVVRDSEAAKIVDTVVKVARTGSVGDGKIFVSPVGEVYRIRTGEKGETAL
ncbi:transcriptional regulator [candidate division WOR-1 bacterium RIFCSPHIGHO2_01_FULL_53_15]|uniref:Transcriptional regulator n=1 Tax=candidate division WOR-1 bacterium RIFCSPHIGHO2_01_FULL_53_15 TaxID=1802564 RepID=A0A1F4Q1I0_UNCSA|nr:MAG: transcriptional regulator [candidate division WOR-1 bacterium RIFCSPHIGHO2_01_FULL_53_15]OGC12822.1 MAG: transcriptional regulator [candidate division WOR-1 bacterium RIFCSPHIGHO2_02_FULL_53_26]